MGLQVKDLLNLRTFSEARVRAGHNGLDQIITSVTVGEVPDTPEWLTGGELVLTTYFFLHNAPDILDSWTERLIERGASAIAIKPSRFVGPIPTQLLRLSETKAVPLIELPFNIRWSEIITEVTYHLWESHLKDALQRELLHSRLLSLFVESTSYGQIADLVAKATENLIIIEDSDLNVFGIGYPPGPRAREIETSVLRRRLTPATKYWIKDLFVCNKSQRVDSETFRKYRISQVITPVLSKGVKLLGFITLLETKKPATRSEKSLLLEVGSMLARKIEVNQIEASGNSSMLPWQIRDHEGYHLHFSKLNLSNLCLPASAAIVSITGVASDSISTSFTNTIVHNPLGLPVQKLELMDILRDYLLGADRVHLLGESPEGDSVILLVHADDGSVSSRSALTNLYRGLKSVIGKDTNLRMFVGAVCEDSTSITLSIEEASFTSWISHHLGTNDEIVFFNDLGLAKFCFVLRDEDSTDRVSQSVLRPLLEYDRVHRTNLTETLDVFLKTNGSLKETARRLYLHHNTVSYRLKKIQTILETDLTDLGSFANIRLALEMRAIASILRDGQGPHSSRRLNRWSEPVRPNLQPMRH